MDRKTKKTIQTLNPHHSARDAAMMMTEHDISAVIVVDDEGALVGIVTERDLSRRVVGENLNGAEVSLGEIMTPQPARLRPEDSARSAMDTMRELRIRHLPVVEDERVIGIVSIRDLRSSLSRQVVTV